MKSIFLAAVAVTLAACGSGGDKPKPAPNAVVPPPETRGGGEPSTETAGPADSPKDPTTPAAPTDGATAPSGHTPQDSDSGATAPSGSAGPSGATGATGTSGDADPAPANGAAGATGPTGALTPTGSPTGPAGPTGAIPPTGSTVPTPPTAEPTPTTTPVVPAAPAGADVVLVDANSDIDPKALVFSTATILDPAYIDETGAAKTFQSSVVNTVGAKYVGYALPVQVQADGAFTATLPIRAFIARYGQTVTAEWANTGVTPAAPDFLTNDVREVASSPVEVKAVQGLPAHPGNLRVYRSRVRTAYTAATGYGYEEGLLLFYIAPADGKIATFLFSASTGTVGLYKLTSGAIPAAPAAASLVDVIHAADALVAIKPGSPQHFQVPFHSFVAESYRVTDGQSHRGEGNPFGPALILTTPETQILNDLWIAVRGAGASAAQLDALYALTARLAL